MKRANPSREISGELSVLDLPTEILWDILSRLDVPDLSHAARSCTRLLPVAMRLLKRKVPKNSDDLVSNCYVVEAKVLEGQLKGKGVMEAFDSACSTYPITEPRKSRLGQMQVPQLLYHMLSGDELRWTREDAHKAFSRMYRDELMPVFGIPKVRDYLVECLLQEAPDKAEEFEFWLYTLCHEAHGYTGYISDTLGEESQRRFPDYDWFG